MQTLKSPTKRDHKIISPTASAGGVSGAGSVDINSNGTIFSGSPDAKESIASRSEANYPIIDSHSGIWDPRRNQKILRFVTVIAYIFFVSLAAIVLSLYYYFFHVPHMGTSGYMDGRVGEDSLKSMKTTDFGAQNTPIESIVGRGRKRFSLQHQMNVNHFPLEATSHGIDAATGQATSQSKCDNDRTTMPSLMESRLDDDPATTEAITVRFTRHESPPETVAQVLPLNARAYSLPTVPSVYEMIARRFKGRHSALQRQETATNADNYED